MEAPDASFDRDLHHLVRGTARHTGAAFFRALVQNLADVLGLDGSWVTEYDAASRRLRAFAFYHRGGWIEGYEYAIDGTPCAPVIDRQAMCHIPDRVVELFPGDPDLAPLGAVSYLGAPLLDDRRMVMGHLAVLDGRPLRLTARMQGLFEVFAARAAAELTRVRAEQKLREHEQQLAGVVASAMDAIFELDEDLRIRLMNPAAERAFGCEAASRLGRPFAQLLQEDASERVGTLAAELGNGSGDPGHVWLSDLAARRSDGRAFTAEATLSLVHAERGRRYTVILRDIQSRLEAERRIRALTAERAVLLEEIRQRHDVSGIIGTSDAMRGALEDLRRVAGTSSTVLLLGESGTGKELFARAVHELSDRSDGPLVKLNCAALPAHLVESELFGHEKGAFTGATSSRRGRFETAHGGTIFLDEVGELAAELQAKLLRVLQEGEIERVGSTTTIAVDVRVVAATNRDLESMVRDGTFREDLYYRLCVFPVRIPPLRERPGDVVLLAESFMDRCARRLGKRFEPLGEAAKARLESYAWPGNVRELQNVVERAVILSQGPDLDLARALPEDASSEACQQARQACPDEVLSDREVRRIERDNLVRALRVCGGRIAGAGGAAERLGLRPTTLASRLKSLGIRRSDYQDSRHS